MDVKLMIGIAAVIIVFFGSSHLLSVPKGRPRKVQKDGFVEGIRWLFVVLVICLVVAFMPELWQWASGLIAAGGTRIIQGLAAHGVWIVLAVLGGMWVYMIVRR